MKRFSSQRRLSVEQLEDRRVMAGVPALSSLAGAAHTVYLDFNGHVEGSWREVGTGINYLSVVSQAFDRDGVPGAFGVGDFNTTEVNSIQRVWAMVAEDFSPFNVNVTTVEPPASNTNVVRVVIGGQENAYYIDPRTASLKTTAGNSFILNSDFTPSNASGCAPSIGSYQNADSNTVYVFSNFHYGPGGQLMTPEQIGNTASHEAGHAFGLIHHQLLATDNSGMFFRSANGKPIVKDEYHPGNVFATPIMGNNLSTGNRHVWTNATNRDMPGIYQNEYTTLMVNLGLRADEPGNSLSAAQAFNFGFQYRDLATGEDVRQGWTRGVISGSSDFDYYSFNSIGGSVTVGVGVEQDANLDASLWIYRKDSVIRLVNGIRQTQTSYTLIATVDPPLDASNPYGGLSAAWSGSLAAGTYVAVVGSHGGIGDMGQYQLGILNTMASNTVALNNTASRAPQAAAADAVFALLSIETTTTKRGR